MSLGYALDKPEKLSPYPTTNKNPVFMRVSVVFNWVFQLNHQANRQLEKKYKSKKNRIPTLGSGVYRSKSRFRINTND